MLQAAELVDSDEERPMARSRTGAYMSIRENDGASSHASCMKRIAAWRPQAMPGALFNTKALACRQAAEHDMAAAAGAGAAAVGVDKPQLARSEGGARLRGSAAARRTPLSGAASGRAAA